MIDRVATRVPYCIHAPRNELKVIKVSGRVIVMTSPARRGEPVTQLKEKVLEAPTTNELVVLRAMDLSVEAATVQLDRSMVEPEEV